MIDSVWESAQPAKPKTNGDVNSIDRLPPHSPEAERGILGCIMIKPQECMAEVIERLKDNGREFYDLRHMTIWDTMVEMYDRTQQIDTITLQEELKKKDMLEQCGGITFLSALEDGVPSSKNLPEYLSIVVEKYILRSTARVCAEVVGRIYDYEGDVDDLMDNVEQDLIQIRDRRVQQSLPTIKELITGNIQTIEEYSQRQGILTGLATGFSDFDRMTSGLQAGEMIVIAARPSMGKTSLAMNIAEQVAVEQKLPVGVFSLEMSAPALSLRMLCSRARVNIRNVRDGFLAERDFPKLSSAASKIANAPLYIDDTGTMTVMQLRAKARRMVAKWGIKLFVIDYLQLLSGSSRRSQSRQDEVSGITRGIKALAKELNVPVIVLSQLNREVEREKSRQPRLSDLRESGEIEQAADVVGFLYRPAKDDDDSKDYEDAIAVNLLIGKSRNGPTGNIPLVFLREFTRFETAAKVSYEDVTEQREFAP